MSAPYFLSRGTYFSSWQPVVKRDDYSVGLRLKYMYSLKHIPDQWQQHG